VGKGVAVKVCPRCGLPYNYISREKRSSSIYVYAVHVYYSGDKRKVRKCYLGAERYTYVSLTNPELGELTGLFDKTKALRYLEQLLEWLLTADLKTVEEAISIVRRYEVELLARREELKRMEKEELEAEAET